MMTASPETAVAVDPGTAKGGRSIELPPGHRAGTERRTAGPCRSGQTVDLSTGEGLDEAVKAQRLAEGVIDFEPVVQRWIRCREYRRGAATSAGDARRHRPTEAEHAGKALEGFDELVYREGDGTHVVVDYKTDCIPDGTLSMRTKAHAPQIRSYAHAVGKCGDYPATGRVLFLRDQGNRHYDARQSADALTRLVRQMIGQGALPVDSLRERLRSPEMHETRSLSLAARTAKYALQAHGVNWSSSREDSA